MRTRIVPSLLALALAHGVLATVPAGFTDALVASVPSPTALAFTPDGRLLVTTQPGALRVYRDGQLLATPALTFSSSQICSENERGLLGVAVDPQFATNHFIYLYYTAQKYGSCVISTSDPSTPVNRVSRFVLPESNVVDPAGETVIVDGIQSKTGSHNGGDLQFGKDGYLYVSVGDGAVYPNARYLNILNGKVLRVTRDGEIPPGNPFLGAGTARCSPAGSTSPDQVCQETFAWGLRNPFRIVFDPNAPGTVFRINDVGQGGWEEIDAAQAGTDYGWVCREGAHVFTTASPCNPAPPNMVDPIFEYAHNTQIPGTTSPTNCNAIVGGAFVPNGLWPGFDGVYLFGDLVCGGIFKLTGSGPYAASDFASSLGEAGVVSMTFGPLGSTQALYYTSYASGGQVRRISYGPPPTRLTTLPPCRVLDTRGTSALAANVPRSVAASGACGIPPTAQSLVVNVTVTQPTAAGDMQVFAGGTGVPVSGVVAFRAGQTRAGAAIVAMGADGTLTAIARMPSGTAHLIVDVSGYFQ